MKKIRLKNVISVVLALLLISCVFTGCKQKENEIQFLLSDNGKGAGKNFKAGFGLKSMAERAKALGGEAQFRYDEEEGFEILLTIQADKEKRV